MLYCTEIHPTVLYNTVLTSPRAVRSCFLRDLRSITRSSTNADAKAFKRWWLEVEAAISGGLAPFLSQPCGSTLLIPDVALPVWSGICSSLGLGLLEIRRFTSELVAVEILL